MEIICLDLEGTLFPEIWQEVAKATGLVELNVTTKEEPDYDKLMKKRLSILDTNGLKIADVLRVVETLQPYDGAVEFLDNLRKKAQVVIISDTFWEFMEPVMEKLHYPTIFCHNLEMSEDGTILGYNLRTKDQKKAAVSAFHLLGFRLFAAGDSLNDISMIEHADSGVLFRTSEEIAAKCRDINTMDSYEELDSRIDAFIKGEY